MGKIVVEKQIFSCKMFYVIEPHKFESLDNVLLERSEKWNIQRWHIAGLTHLVCTIHKLNKPKRNRFIHDRKVSKGK